jgi:hypothetical protein
MAKFLKKISSIPSKLWLTLGVGFLLGVFSLVAIRFITYETDNVHYHANFSMFVNGEKDEFESFTFYEEVQACVADGADNPRSRVHMHDRQNSVVHVHSSGATWGHFFANLGYVLGDELIKTDDGIFVDSEEDKELTFILNGESVPEIANRIIENEDRLLINYGSEQSDEIEKRFDAVPSDAGEYNQRHDPSGCAGDSKLTFGQRLKQAIGISPASHDKGHE